MSKKKTKSKLQTKDLTIKDYADSKCSAGRLSKGKCPNQPDIENFEPLDTHEGVVPQKKSHGKRNRKNIDHEVDDPNRIYNNYHIDIWFLISEHIFPEDVGRFALICRKTEKVVSSARFWFTLYRRFYKNKFIAEFPHPRTMIINGLRSIVIKSLFYTYDLFVERIKMPPDLDTVLKHGCIGIWYMQIKDAWKFCYKFRQNIVQRKVVCGDLAKSNRTNDKELAERISDIYANSEEGCYILVIVTPKFRPPLLLSQNVRLTSINKPLSQNLRNYKIELEFSNYCNTHISSIVYDPVLQSKVIAWWHPDYSTHLSSHSQENNMFDEINF